LRPAPPLLRHPKQGGDDAAALTAEAQPVTQGFSAPNREAPSLLQIQPPLRSVYGTACLSEAGRIANRVHATGPASVNSVRGRAAAVLEAVASTSHQNPSTKKGRRAGLTRTGLLVIDQGVTLRDHSAC
jgi:hypothetical protein